MARPKPVKHVIDVTSLDGSVFCGCELTVYRGIPRACVGGLTREVFKCVALVEYIGPEAVTGRFGLGIPSVSRGTLEVPL